MKIDPAEVRRYLGYHGHPAGKPIEELIASCSQELLGAVSPRSLYRTFDLELSDRDTLSLAGFTVQSKSLYAHLTGCTRAALFAATLGPAPDLLLRRYAKTDITRAAVLQACAADLIESYCNEEEGAVAREAERQGFFILPRFSPGYGDFSLRHQKDMLGVLNSSKQIGLSLTESFMLVPTKSVTAVIGFTTKKTNRSTGGCAPGGCAHCSALRCQFRRSK